MNETTLRSAPARARLEKALDRLEAAVDACVERTAERESRLTEEFDDLKGRHAALRDLNLTVSRRLDRAVGRLKTVLGE